MSSKHPTPLPPLSSSLLRPKAQLPRDPRFDPLLPSTSVSPHFNARGAYAFLDDLKREEVDALRTAQKRVRSADKRRALSTAIASAASERRSAEAKEREKAALKGWRAEEERRRREGKGKFWLKDKDRKKVQLVAEYVRMQDKGQGTLLQRKVEKKRKRRKAQDQRSMPSQH